jgi:hypothetical protein
VCVAVVVGVVLLFAADVKVSFYAVAKRSVLCMWAEA